jgi:hypothetical protein
MYEKRYQFWTDAKSSDDDFAKRYSTYNAFEKHFFTDENTFNNFFNLLRDHFNFSQSIKVCYQKFACDLDWAKNLEYCKVAPKQDQWLDLEEDNKSTFIEEFPCIASIISGNGRQKMYPEGMVFLLPVNFEGRKCNVYMLNSGDETKSKWDGLIIDRATKERGQFKCEGDEGNSSSDLDNE